MEELVFMKQGSSGATQFIKSIVNANELVENVDFEVVSFIVQDSDFDVYSLGKFIGVRSNQLFQNNKDYLKQAEALLEESEKYDEILFVSGTMFQKKNNNVFYRVNGEVDIDLATDVGLGVVRYKGEYMIYSPNNTNDEFDAENEMLRLKVYFQLMYPDILDDGLRNYFEDNDYFIGSILLGASPNNLKIMQQLEMIFEKFDY